MNSSSKEVWLPLGYNLTYVEQDRGPSIKYTRLVKLSSDLYNSRNPVDIPRVEITSMPRGYSLVSEIGIHENYKLANKHLSDYLDLNHIAKNPDQSIRSTDQYVMVDARILDMEYTYSGEVLHWSTEAVQKQIIVLKKDPDYGELNKRSELTLAAMGLAGDDVFISQVGAHTTRDDARNRLYDMYASREITETGYPSVLNRHEIVMAKDVWADYYFGGILMNCHTEYLKDKFVVIYHPGPWTYANTSLSKVTPDSTKDVKKKKVSLAAIAYKYL